jgi:hypothetical protein
LCRSKYDLWSFKKNRGYSSVGERLNGIQEVSGSIPLSSTSDQSSWDYLLINSFENALSWVIIGLLLVLFLVYAMLQKNLEKRQRFIRQRKQQVYDRWHDQED